MTPLELLRSRLEGSKPTRRGFTARCPAHDDRKSSLSVGETDDGRALIICFAGCETRDVLRALGLRWSDLYPSDRPDDGRPGAGGRLVASYDYRDEAGDLLYQVVRYDPKDFRQRRPDGDGGWDWSLGDVRRVLYRLPELTSADSTEPVFVAEGEKDADTLAALGLVVTTNAGGAAKWQDVFAEPLSGRLVVILPDNDEAGRRHSAAVGRSLHGVAADVRVLRLPDLPQNGDVSDWLAAGGTAEALHRLAAEAPPWAPSEEPSGARSGENNARGHAGPQPLQHPAFHGLAGEIVRALDPHTEADPAAILTNILVMAGSAIGATPHAWVGQARHGVNLFVVQVGETAKGRKGTGLSGPRHLVREADPEWRGRLVSGLSSGEGVIHAVRDPIEKQEPIKEKVNGRQEVTGYQTVVVDPGAEDKRLLVLEEEFASTLKVAGREGNTLSPVLRQAWDGEDLQILTKNSPERATAPHVAVIGHVTKDELLRYLDSTEGANGFANRFLWVCVKRSKVLPEGGEVPGAILEELTQRLIEVIEFARTAAEISRDKDAKALWADIYPELSEGKPGLFGAVTARAEAQVLRLSALYALLDRSAVIRVEHLVAALAIWDYCEASARYIFGDVVGDPIADRILSTLRTEGSKSQTDLSALFGRHIEANRIARALETLLRAQLVTSERQETEGRTKTIWHAA